MSPGGGEERGESKEGRESEESNLGKKGEKVPAKEVRERDELYI